MLLNTENIALQSLRILYIFVLRRCYTMQLVLQLISQRIYFENSSCMVRDVTLCNVSCNLSRNRF